MGIFARWKKLLVLNGAAPPPLRIVFTFGTIGAILGNETL